MSQSAQILAAAAAIRRRWPQRPRAGIILGTGLGSFASQIVRPTVIDYAQIPHFKPSTAMGHVGRLVCGTVADIPVITMEGRWHLYEGYTHREIALPVRVMKHLGVDLLILSNASGGIHPRLSAGDLVVIEDQINLMWGNPLIGPNEDAIGPRFPDMSAPFDGELMGQALEIARVGGFVATRGVYAGVTGPNYETRAEYRMLRRMGADVVGMSTVPEVLAAAHAGLRILAVSVVANVCDPDQLTPTQGSEVVAVGESTEPKLRDIVTGVLARLHPLQNDSASSTLA